LKPERDRFEKWVFDEILPLVREFGSKFKNRVIFNRLTSIKNFRGT